MGERAGVKDDSGKMPVWRGVLNYFPRALGAVAAVSAFGADKYSWNGWRSVPDARARYFDALGRHLLADTQEAFDAESGLPHLAHAAWCLLALLQMELENEDELAQSIDNQYLAEVEPEDIEYL